MDKKQEILKEIGMKVTRNRLAVLDLLMTSQKPLSVEEIFKKLKNVDQVTIYRILNQFSEKNIIKKIDLRYGKSFFEFQDHHHHHIVCESCGCLEEVDVCLPENFLKKIQKSSNQFKKVSDHSLEFFGVCNKCSKI